jgi:porphobilinogen deaminase
MLKTLQGGCKVPITVKSDFVVREDGDTVDLK